MTQWSVREVQVLAATVPKLAWSIGCSGRSFTIVSSPVVFIPFLCSKFHFCLTHLESQSCNTVQAERDLRWTLVQLLAQISVKSNILPWTLSVLVLKPSKDAYCTVCLGSLSCCLAENQNYTWFGLLPFSLLFISSFIYFIALKLNKGFVSLILKSPFRYWKGTSEHLQNLPFFSLTKSNSSSLSLYGACSSPSDLGGLPLNSKFVDTLLVLQWTC